MHTEIKLDTAVPEESLYKYQTVRTQLVQVARPKAPRLLRHMNAAVFQFSHVNVSNKMVTHLVQGAQPKAPRRGRRRRRTEDR